MNKVVYLSVNAFAKLVGVSHPAVLQAIKEGRVAKTTKGIDPTHPTNIHYQHLQDGRRKQLIKAKTTKAITIKKKIVKRPSKGKKKKPKKKINRQRESLQESIDQAEEEVTNPSPINSDHNSANHDTALQTLNAKKLKELEQVKKLQVETEIKRKQLVDRAIIERVFSELYLVDTNELKTLGGKLAPRIAAKYKIDDGQKIIEVERMIEAEVYRSLEHIKRIFNDVLEELETEMIP
jgi:hypothetical protein